MEALTIQCTLPPEFSENIVSALESKAEERAAALAQQIADGRKQVNLREASKITGYAMADLRRAAKAKLIGHTIHKGKPFFQLRDLWAYMDSTRVEAKQI